MTPERLAEAAKAAAAALGFDACGITGLAPNRTADHLDAWLALGMHGEMRYMARQADTRRNPAAAWPDAKSVVVVLHTYLTSSKYGSTGAIVAKYAQGVDYHGLIKGKLRDLGVEIAKHANGGSFRYYVDAGSMPERELAVRAGLGWSAKNTMVINPGLGSYTFIGCLLTDLELAQDSPFEADRCGTCTRCLDACPTEAFPAPHVLDATRCVSYLTIEAKADVPPDLRPGVGVNLFGCDICQDVCPWNQRFAEPAREPRLLAPEPDERPDLHEILAMDERGFEAAFGHTAFERAGLGGLQRNARVVLENQSREPAVS